ncbi:MAG: U32 family peptidase, partial [Oscillospiraceae bacterium]|nr:U32 family peptidase [Oscillospiraceae bacterium]
MIPELLSPAGDEESLSAAIRYGADAVYLGAKSFGMRAGAANFQEDELAGAVNRCHAAGVKLYLTCNTLPREDETRALPDFIRGAGDSGADALIIADIGVFALAKRLCPDLPVHVSTQLGVVNHLTATELYNMGAERVVLARELTLPEIAEIRAKTPAPLMLEAFAHGAMCVSVSGRCVLSNYMAGRDANRGACAQPCRWRYALMEQERPGQYYPVFEEDGYTYTFNANDLCMIEHLDLLKDAGVGSLKLEGRAKSAYYVASVTWAYRRALDILKASPDAYRLPAQVLAEVDKISHRPYSTGFYLPGEPPDQDRIRGGYSRSYDLVATVEGREGEFLIVTGRNRFFAGEELEALRPDGDPVAFVPEEIHDPEGELITV